MADQVSKIDEEQFLVYPTRLVGLSNTTCRSSLGEMIMDVLSGIYEHRWQDVPGCIDSGRAGGQAGGQAGRKTDRHTYRQTDRQTDRQADRQKDRQTDRQTDIQTDIQTDR